MYPSSSSSSSCSITQTGLTRYGSAPSSVLTSAADAVMPHCFSGESTVDRGGLYEVALAGSSALVRQSSSPAGFLTHLASTASNAGFTITRGTGTYTSRLTSQLSFTGLGQESLSQISEMSEDAVGVEPWDNHNSGSILFSVPPTKRSKHIDGDILNALESQFSLPQTSLEMAAMGKLLHIPQHSVPCKVSAKRGCATHPRSIAERERRTRISGKLKKLQDLVPNMDKQTSYADMLDLAVQHIKGLQSQVQKLHKELENCTCGCKEST